MTMTFIASVIATGSAQPSFSSIPQNFTHLQIRAFSRSGAATSISNVGLQFNSDGGANYCYGWHYLKGDGSTATSGNGGGTGYPTIYTFQQPGTSVTSTVWANGIIDILDYTNTSKNKVVRSFGGFDANGSGSVILSSGLWLSTAAISGITIADSTSPYLPAVGSRFDLYGISTSNSTGA